jgi:hypothetical protein
MYYTLYNVIYNGGKRSGGPEPWLHAGFTTPRKRPAEITCDEMRSDQTHGRLLQSVMDDFDDGLDL